jgi:hypothetical protein
MWRRVGAVVLVGSLMLLSGFIGFVMGAVVRFGTLVWLSLPPLLSGCGPTERPMPARLDEETQKKIDEAWEKALAPVNHLDHQQWLDTFVLTGAFEAGVNRLSFRSEKEFSGGLVVMEVHYDRQKPDDDRFEMSVFDHAGKRLRHERYTRVELQQTSSFFHEQIPPAGPNQPEPPEQARKRQARAAREKVIKDLFPKPQEAEGKAKPNP